MSVLLNPTRANFNGYNKDYNSERVKIVAILPTKNEELHFFFKLWS